MLKKTKIDKKKFCPRQEHFGPFVLRGGAKHGVSLHQERNPVSNKGPYRVV